MENGLQPLSAYIKEQGLCVFCGGCAGLCPHITFFDGKVIETDPCHRADGRCHDVCPVAHGDIAGGEEEPIGVVKAVYQARGLFKTPSSGIQYGGAVSALSIAALDSGLIDEAVMTAYKDQEAPQGVIVKASAEVLNCAGSHYASSAVLATFNERLKGPPAQIGIVGLPCQIHSLGLACKTASPQDRILDDLALTIGLFCTWALSFRALKRFLTAHHPRKSPIRYDIPPLDGFQVFFEDETVTYPLAEIRPFIHKGCQLCTDLTAEKSDVSVGALEGTPGWNTLITRTEKGEALVREAQDRGLLMLEAVPENALRHLTEASLIKRQKGRQNRAHTFLNAPRPKIVKDAL